MILEQCGNLAEIRLLCSEFQTKFQRCSNVMCSGGKVLEGFLRFDELIKYAFQENISWTF